MKLISLHITAFGGVADRDLSFGEGLTEIVDKNGAGKSTLAAFIKMMLYGLDGARANQEENEYRLYEPWQGGRFGGTLTLSHEGRTYRIERFYERVGKTKTPQESLTVIDLGTGLATDRLGSEPGRTLFGVDGPSFLRTAYLSSRAISAGKTPDISAKLGGSEGEEADMAQLEKALKLLKNKRNEIRTTKKQQNGQKQLDLAERELRRIEEEIEAARAALGEEANEAREAAIVEKELAALGERLGGMRQRRNELEKADALAAANQSRRKELEAECHRLAETLSELGKGFPNGLPSDAETKRLEDNARECRRLLDEVNAYHEKREEIPLPTAAEMAALRNAVNDRKMAEEAAALPPPPPIQTEKTKRPLILGCCAAAAAAVGVVLFFLSVIPAVIALLFAVGLAVAAYLLARGEAAAADAKAGAAKKASEEAEARLAALRTAAEAARDLLASFGLAADADVQELYALQERAFAARHAEKAATDAKAGADALQAEVAAALALYRGLPEDTTAAIATLRERLARYRATEDALSAKRRELSLLPAAPTAEGAAPISPTEALKAEIEVGEERARQLTAALAVHNQKRAERRTVAEGLYPLLDRREELLAEIRDYEARLLTLDRTAAFLEEAGAAYEERYLGGIRRHIGRYARRLLSGATEDVQIDLDLQLSFLQGGEAHGAYYQSTGLRAIADVCLRLALTDALYPETPPPLVLDDPFTALDEKNLDTALSLLRELCEERQILYLTCHPSRSTVS